MTHPLYKNSAALRASFLILAGMLALLFPASLSDLLRKMPRTAGTEFSIRETTRKTSEEQAGQSPAQTPLQQHPEGDVVRLNSDLVLVPVSVTDSSGCLIRNISPRDFLLTENGQPQEVVLLGQPGQSRVELALLFDISGSLHERFEFEANAASEFLRTVLRPGDAASIFSIGEEPKLVQNRTMDVNKAIDGVASLHPTREATAFYRSVAAAARYLGDKGAKGARRALVVISDGEDNLSDEVTWSDVRRELQLSDCLFYSINPGGSSMRLNRISLKGQASMAALAAETGGAAYVAEGTSELSAFFHQIAEELQSQYLLGYYPGGERLDGKFRQILVQVKSRPDLRVRARQGYFASPQAKH